VPGERVTLDLDGPTVEVERLSSWVVEYEFSRLLDRFNAATGPAAEHAALADVFTRFVLEAQPTWDIVDHRGAVPATTAGLARLPLPIALSIVSLWSLTSQGADEVPEDEVPEDARPEVPGLRLVESDAPSAVDAVIPPGPFNRQIKKQLRAVKTRA
jgi:hypothetical protein